MERAPDPDEVRYGDSPVMNNMGGSGSDSEDGSDSDSSGGGKRSKEKKSAKKASEKKSSEKEDEDMEPEPNPKGDDPEFDILGYPRKDADGRPIIHSEGSWPAEKIPPEEGMPSERDLRQLKEHLNKLLNPTSAPAITANLAPMTLNEQVPAPAYQAIYSIEAHRKVSFMNYSADKGCFLKIYTSLPKFIPVLRDLFEKDRVTFRGRIGHFSDITYEGQIPCQLRFLVDQDLPGMSWIRIPAGCYFLRKHEEHASTVQIEIDVMNYKDVEPIPIEVDASIAPLRIMSFDIEVTTDGVRFPTACRDAVIQIANVVKCQGSEVPFVRNVFTLDTCAPIMGTQVFCFKTEKELLEAWRDFLLEVDPDIVTGYNI